MSDRPPPPPPRLPPVSAKREGWSAFFFTTGGIILSLTAIVGVLSLLITGCLTMLGGKDVSGQIVGLMISFAFAGAFFLWLGMRRPKR
jgi:hypothetical protein